MPSPLTLTCPPTVLTHQPHYPSLGAGNSHVAFLRESSTFLQGSLSNLLLQHKFCSLLFPWPSAFISKSLSNQALAHRKVLAFTFIVWAWKVCFGSQTLFTCFSPCIALMSLMVMWLSLTYKEVQTKIISSDKGKVNNSMYYLQWYQCSRWDALNSSRSSTAICTSLFNAPRNPMS